MVRYWNTAHRGIKGGLIAASLVAAFGLHSTFSTPPPVEAATEELEPVAVRNVLGSLQERLGRRAGVQLSEDFRTGLHDWDGGRGWGDSWSYDQAGFVRTGQLALYTPSAQMSDYTVQFVGQIEKKGLGWVVRAADVNNYVALKLVHTRSAPLPRIALVRYTVIDGKEDKQQRISIPMEIRSDTMLHVRTEVRGNRYVVFVQDRIVDAWEEKRRPAGSIGFFSSKGEQARVNSLKVTFQYDWVGRLCAALAG